MMMRIIVDKSVDHANPDLICFFYHNIEVNERNLLTIENTDSPCIMQMSNLCASHFRFKAFANSLEMQK